MKLSRRHPDVRRYATARRGERGFLVIALLAIVAIMLIYVNVNVRLLGNLKRELRLIEQQQIQRLENIGAQPLRLTNRVVTSAIELNTAPAR